MVDGRGSSRRRVSTGTTSGIAGAGGRAGADGEQARLRPHPMTAEDLGDDVMALAVVARSAGRASVLRHVDGVLVRLTVEAA